MTFATQSHRQGDIPPDRPNPERRDILVQRLARAPWWTLIIGAIVFGFIIEVYDRNLYQEAWQDIREGIYTTLWVTIVAYSVSLLMGLTIAVLRRPSKSIVYNVLVYQPVTAYVEFIRGIPTLVLLLYIVLALFPQLVSWGNELGAWMQANDLTALGIADYISTLKTRDVPNEYRAIIALAISYSAFLSEVFRAGLESIEWGQQEAAASLGLSRWQIMRFIILPQAIRNILPPLGNDFIAMLKESSLVSVVGVDDITRLGRNFSSATFTLFPAYNIVAITYLVLTLGLSLFVKMIELYMGRSRQRD